MTTNHEFETPRAELARLLDTWSGNPARWPPRARARIAALSATVPEASALLAQAHALDRLLDAAREAPARVSPARMPALTDRIMAAALAESPAAMPAIATAPQPASDNVVAFRSKPPHRPVPIRDWQTAGLIAACLMAGIYLGGSLNLTPVLQELAEAAGMSTVIDSAVAAMGEDLNDEETL